MDNALLEQPLIAPTDRPRVSYTAEQVAKLRSLPSEDYWLAIAEELTWTKPPTVALEGKLGDFRYFPGATGNVSVNCLDRWPKERVALRYEREDGLKETWTFGELGAVTIGKPFPCLARTVWNDHPRYVENYLSRFPGHYFAADGGLFDKDGQLWVTGRLDDVINVAGHRIGTMELEAALLTHAAVSEAAVVPQPDAIKGVVPVAFVVPRAGHEPSRELSNALAQAVVDAVGSIARPARVIVVSTVPRTRSGKIMRRVLRDLLTGGEAKGDLTSLDNPDAIDVVKAAIARVD